MADKIIFEVELDASNTVTGFKAITDSAEKSSSKIKQSFDGSGITKFNAGLSATTKLLAGITTLAASFGLYKIIQKSTAAAIEQENAINALNSALARNGNLTKATAQAMSDFASAIQNTTKFGDETILQNAALLESLTGLRADGLKAATAAAVDLAAALQLDLGTAVTAVGKAINGEAGSLGRYGIEVAKGKNQTEQLANVLQSLSRFSGAAASELNTFAGAATNLGNVIGDLFEIIGDIIIKSPALIETFKIIKEQVIAFSTSLAGSVGGQDLLKPLILGALALGQALNTIVTGPIEFILLGLNGIRLALASSVNAFLTGVVQISGFIANLLFKPIDGYIKLVGQLTSLFSQSQGQKILSISFDAQEAISGFTKQISGPLNESSKMLGEDAARNFRNAFKFETTMGINDSIDAIAGRIAEARNIGQKFGEAIGTGLESGLNTTKAAVNDIRELLKDLSTNTVKAFATQLGENLGRGAGAFDDFGKVAKNLLGDFMITLGGSIVAQSTAMKALFDTIATMGALGPIGIVAGIALIAAGAALKASGGPMTAVGSPTTQVGAAPVTPVGVTPVEPIGEDLAPVAEQIERAAPAQDIKVIVQGNILNTRESALHIATILKDVIRGEGVTIQPSGALA